MWVGEAWKLCILQPGRGKNHELEERMWTEQLTTGHKSFQPKWALEKDAKEYQRLSNQERWDIFAFCNQEGKKCLVLEERMRSKKMSTDNKTYVLKWSTERDEESYLIKSL
jgi:hypothetical protein